MENGAKYGLRPSPHDPRGGRAGASHNYFPQVGLGQTQAPREYLRPGEHAAISVAKKMALSKTESARITGIVSEGDYIRLWVKRFRATAVADG